MITKLINWKFYNVENGYYIKSADINANLKSFDNLTSFSNELNIYEYEAGIGDVVSVTTLKPRDITLIFDLGFTGNDYYNDLKKLLGTFNANCEILCIGNNLISDNDGNALEGGLHGYVNNITLNRLSKQCTLNVSLHCCDPYIYQVAYDSNNIPYLMTETELFVGTRGFTVPTKTGSFSTADELDLKTIKGQVPSKIRGYFQNNGHEGDLTQKYYGKMLLDFINGGAGYYNSYEMSIAGNIENSIPIFGANEQIDFSNKDGDISITNNYYDFYQGNVDCVLLPYSAGIIMQNLTIYAIASANDTDTTVDFVYKLYATERWY